MGAVAKGMGTARNCQLENKRDDPMRTRATVEIVKKGLPKLLEKAIATDAKEVNHEPF